MTAVACALCGRPSTSAFVTPDRNRRVSAEQFTYYRCSVCGTLSLRPVPLDLERYYPSAYYTLPRTRGDLLGLIGSEQYKLDIVGGFVASGRLVEIGPAGGGFVAAALQAGYEASVIEMDGECCRTMRNMLGIEAHETDDPGSALSAHGPFDVVAMWHAIEHLPHPRDVLVAAATALAPGGVIAVATPNPDAFQFSLFGTRWTHVDAPRHLALIPAKTLAGVGRDLGLEMVMQTTRDPGTLVWNTFGWRESLAGFATGARASGALRAVGSVLGRAARPIELHGHNGSAYTLVLRKPTR